MNKYSPQEIETTLNGLAAAFVEVHGDRAEEMLLGFVDGERPAEQVAAAVKFARLTRA